MKKINYIFSATMTDLYKYYVVGDTVNGYELKNDGKDCISIESKEEMEYLSKYTNANYVTENVTFVLINDIDLNPGVTIGTDGTITGGTPEEWISIGTGNPFKGILDGCNYSMGLIKISNCYSNCDVILSYPEGKSVERTVYFGDLIGVVFGNVTIENLYGKTNKNTELLPENACQFGRYIGALKANYRWITIFRSIERYCKINL